jgi:hypothetical protein
MGHEEPDAVRMPGNQIERDSRPRAAAEHVRGPVGQQVEQPHRIVRADLDPVRRLRSVERATRGATRIVGDDAINTAWLAASLLAATLLAWFALLALDGPLAKAEPKTIRYRLLHVAARLTHGGRRHYLRIDETWPWVHDLLAAFARVQALPAGP